MAWLILSASNGYMQCSYSDSMSLYKSEMAKARYVLLECTAGAVILESYSKLFVNTEDIIMSGGGNCGVVYIFRVWSTYINMD